MSEFEKIIGEWDGECVLTRLDEETGTWMIIAIHSSVLGVPTGGTRLKSYATIADAVRDATRLAAGMTQKFAVIDIPRGGGKCVLAVPSDFDPSRREGLMSRYGAWLAELEGVYETGPDLGTTSRDMDIISRHFAGVFGRSPENGGGGDPGPETALGVLCGIQASCDHLFGTRDLSGRTVLVQGAGSVGRSLMRRLVAEGAVVKFSDVHRDTIAELRDTEGLAFVDPEAAYREPCDVFAPCATGGILNSDTVPALRCRIVAGSANNQLATPADGEALHERGILYAPDYIINAGGAIFLPCVEGWGWTPERARERVRGIGETLKLVFERAAKGGISPARAAEDLAAERLRAGAGDR